MDYIFYIIYNNNCSYAGITNNPEIRIRKHNQEISGGAKYTKMIGKGWQYVCQVHGFKNKNHALQFEWAVKHHPAKNKTGIENRIKKLYDIFKKPQWTKNSPVSIDYKLNIVFYNIFFIPDNYQLPNSVEMTIKLMNDQ
jgi:predicted GIY-YIG superfamily endonuclease